MKNQRFKRIISGILAAVCAAALMAGCSSQKDNNASETNASDTTSAPADNEAISLETKPIAEGDDYAINKISNKTEGEEFPGGYKLVNYSEEAQGKHFANGGSKVIIRAGNYVEDFPDLATWAESTSAGIVIDNITSNAMETNFGKSVETTVCGFDAIYYDCEMIAYEFVENPDDPEGEPVKSEVARFMGRNYYFYSEQDVYAIMFDTKKDSWEEQLPNLEKFVADLQVTKTEY